MSASADTLFAMFNMTPEEVIAFLAKRRLETATDWRDAAKKARAGAFSAARTAGFDVLGDIQSAIASAMREGKTYEEFARELTPLLQRKGWWGKAIDKETGEVLDVTAGGKIASYGSPYRLRTIYQTNLQVAFMAGRYQAMQASKSTHPYWQYIAIMDTRTRPSHAALNGRVFALSDPATQVAYPPNGYNCRCRARALTKRRLEEESLAVSASDGHIEEHEITRPDQPPIKVTAIKLPGMRKAFMPDPGWDHNPAESP
jgi:SPP1 gp7 family putative phage head morphogenesis protein